MSVKRRNHTLIGVRAAILWTLCMPFNSQAQPAENPYNWSNLPEIQQPVFHPDTLDIRTGGAIGDGHTLNTQSINNAIPARCQPNSGLVLIAPGYCPSSPIALKSSVNLHLADNAFLQFTAEFDQDPIAEGNYEGKPSARTQSPITG